MKADRLSRRWEALDVEIAKLQRRQKALSVRVQAAERERDAISACSRRPPLPRPSASSETRILVLRTGSPHRRRVVRS
jgi:hypothetical protein